MLVLMSKKPIFMGVAGQFNISRAVARAAKPETADELDGIQEGRNGIFRLS